MMDVKMGEGPNQGTRSRSRSRSRSRESRRRQKEERDRDWRLESRVDLRSGQLPRYWESEEEAMHGVDLAVQRVQLIYEEEEVPKCWLSI